ncbi:hypothetical protein [Nodularia sp. NIES-3585]|uniref:hypothetical protein n=1 Tax=Nodularia sp. NIES-3585 TaxID=1973477 RepID=UPI000B5CD2A5|nr:hypothetical protein [Nodularia sp. NIES-3585]
MAKLAKLIINKRFDEKVVWNLKPLSYCQYVEKPLWETLKEFLDLIVFVKPIEKWQLMVKASSSLPRKLAKVLMLSGFLDSPKIIVLRLSTKLQKFQARLNSHQT